MSTVTMSTPVRQPFGSVSGARLRKLTNLKNRQNALAATPPSAVKRQAPAEFDEIDTENIDPLQFFSEPSKKAKNFDFDSSHLSKAPLYALNVTPVNTPVKRAVESHAAGSKRKANHNTSNNELRRHEPSSAPVPSAAGRSPKHKRVGILSKRRNNTNLFTRVDPPSFSAHKVSQPFSIAAALHGTVPALKSKHKASRKGWHFDIHEDTQDDEMANLMQHSTQTLEISDDEAGSNSGSPSKGDRCNKENVAPADYQTAVNSTSRRDMMTDDARSPLGDLDTEDYYAEGCDATSVIIIPSEDDEEEDVIKNVVTAEEDSSPTSQSPTTNAISHSHHGWESLLSQMGSKSTTKSTTNPLIDADNDDDDAAKEIHIWESESAKDEAEAEAEAIADATAIVAGKQVAAAA